MSQAIGKQPLLSFSRAGASSAQFLQLLQALEQQEHNQGWPLLSSLKVQVQKCDKCSREYCSSINYRRHLRVHHRLKTLDKDTAKSRDWLGAFWDKLSVEDAKEVVSFKNVALEEVPGSSILKALSALVRKSGFSSLPQLYLKAGSEILDIVQGRPSRFPISSSELFTILDYASEKTFLCGSAASMQKFVFDGDAEKTGLETKNLVACSSFLLEQILINAWRADKDAEALRFHKLLMEEEEAARKRRAEDLEKKRQKRLKQKEQKEKEQIDEEKEDVNQTIDITVEETVDFNETIDNASGKKAVVKETIDNTLREKMDVNVTIDDASEEKADINETMDNASEEKVDVNETMENASEEMLSEETSSSVACDPQIDAANMPNVVQHLSTVEHSNPDINLDLDSLTGFDGGQNDPGNSSPIDEGQFVQGRGRRWRRKMLRKSQMAASPGFHATQGSQAPKPAVAPTGSDAAQVSQASKPGITPSSTCVARVSQSSKPAVAPTSSVSARVSQAPKPAVAPTSSVAARVSQAPKPVFTSSSTYAARVSQSPNPAFAPTSYETARVSQSPKPAVAATSSVAARVSQAPTPAVAPTSSVAARVPQAPKPSFAPSSSYAARVSQSPKPAFAPTRYDAARVSQAPKPATTPSSTYAAQDSQAPKPATTPSSTYAARDSQSPKPAFASTSTDAAQVSQAPKPALAPASSDAAQVSQAPSTIYVAQGSPESKPNVAPTSSDADQVSQASRFAVPRNCGNRTSPRTVSTDHKVWSPKPKPEFAGYSSQTRVQEDAPNEPAKNKKREVIRSSTTGDGFEAGEQKETTIKPTQTKEHVKEVPSPTFDRDSLQARAQQETPNEPDQIKEQNFMIGSMAVPLDDFIRGGNKHSEEAPDAQMAEPEKSDPSPSGTSGQQIVKSWRETLVPNGSRESEECSTSGGIEIVPRRSLLEHGDWESAMRIAEAFHHNRWKNAVAREHFTVVGEEDTDLEEKIVENVDSPASGAGKSEFTAKPKRSTMKKCGPKQRLQIY